MFRLGLLERFALAKMFSLIPPQAQSWLFGSRTNIHARGGDIDILVELDLPEEERFQLSQTLTLGFQKYCDEKIDVIVYPKTGLDQMQIAFREGLQLYPFKRIVNAPRLDHVAVLVRDLEAASESARKWGYPLQKISTFPKEGTQECYVGEPSRSARVLLMQATDSGPYRKALEGRGPGLHHLGICVPSMEYFLENLTGTGWYIHPASVKAIKQGGTVYLARPGAPLLLEVEEEPLKLPQELAPVVSSLRVHIDANVANRISSLEIPELEFTSHQESALLVNGNWIDFDFSGKSARNS